MNPSPSMSTGTGFWSRYCSISPSSHFLNHSFLQFKANTSCDTLRPLSLAQRLLTSNPDSSCGYGTAPQMWNRGCGQGILTTLCTMWRIGSGFRALRDTILGFVNWLPLSHRLWWRGYGPASRTSMERKTHRASIICRSAAGLFIAWNHRGDRLSTLSYTFVHFLWLINGGYAYS